MVYDKVLISLYAEGDPLPKMLAWLEKREEKLRICLSQQSAQSGVLFAFGGGKYLYAIISSKVSAFPLDGFEFGASYLLAFFPDDPALPCLVGGRGETPRAQLLAKFRGKLAQLRRRQESPLDLNSVVDILVRKMFGFAPTAFFDQTKPQLASLFASQKRAQELENIIPSSRFIETLSGGQSAFAGVVYKDKKPFAIGIGFKADGKPSRDGRYQFVFDKSRVGEGYFLVFRQASDGDRVTVATR